VTAVIAVNPKFQFSDTNGTALAGGFIDVYLAGTTTRTTTWQDRGQATANTNPIELDANGECLLWLDPELSYKWVVKNSSGVERYTVDNIAGAGADLDISALATASLANMQSLFNRIYLGAY
jgi:hypothetical protein